MRGSTPGQVSKRGVGEWPNRTTLCPFRVFPLMGNGINWPKLRYVARMGIVLGWLLLSPDICHLPCQLIAAVL